MHLNDAQTDSNFECHRFLLASFIFDCGSTSINSLSIALCFYHFSHLEKMFEKFLNSSSIEIKQNQTKTLLRQRDWVR